MLIDCVWKIGSKPKLNNHEELRYSIRSVVKNFKDLGKVVVVGTKPNWFTGYHIPCDDPFKNKDSNIIRKILVACNDETLTSDIVNISNDQLIIYPITSALLKPYTIDSDLRRVQNTKIASEYGKRIITTINQLKKEGLPTHSYEGHVPYILNRQKYKEILSKYDFTKGKGFCGNTIYFNNLLDNGENPVENVRGFIKMSSPTGKIIEQFKGKLFFGYQRRGLNTNLKNYLKQKYPEKSIYEK